MRATWLFGVVIASACDGAEVLPDAVRGQPDGLPNGWSELLGRAWSLPPGSGDVYKCLRIRTDREMFVSGFRSIAPLGSHHAVLTIGNGGTLGEYDCAASSLDPQMLYASGVGTDDFLLPDGVAVRLPAGTTLNLNLHLYNASDNVLSGHSGVAIQTRAAADVSQEADLFFAGQFQFSIPPDDPNYAVTGGCTVNKSYTAVALWPHMHQYGVHQKVEHIRGGEITVLHDAAYTFSEQDFYPVDALSVASGDQLRVTCTYNNTSGATVGFGDSSFDEMCFAGFYRYPAGGTLFECTDLPQ